MGANSILPHRRKNAQAVEFTVSVTRRWLWCDINNNNYNNNIAGDGKDYNNDIL
ncbi:MAG TPA: hypothetical protein VE521_03685 [Nitrososphaera sp.]|nr:hypothetical protein [Nitrososphaera sp.]